MNRTILLIILLINSFTSSSQVKKSIEENNVENYNKEDGNTKLLDTFPSNESNNFWKEDCDAESSDKILFLDNSRIIFTVNEVHFMCSVVIKKTGNNNEIYLTDLLDDDFSNGVFFSTDDLPEGKRFENFSEKEPIAKVLYVDDSKIEFTWLGFYNTATKERELLKENYLQNTQNSSKTLKNCVKEDNLQLK